MCKKEKLPLWLIFDDEDPRIARRYNWSKSVAQKYVNEYKKTGKLKNKMNHTGRRQKQPLVKTDLSFLSAWITAKKYKAKQIDFRGSSGYRNEILTCNCT